jgi:hypothetical protein
MLNGSGSRRCRRDVVRAGGRARRTNSNIWRHWVPTTMACMRKLIVSNFQTLDGYYESANRTFDRFFDYFH